MILGYAQGVTAFTLLIGYCLNEVNIVINKAWREVITNNRILHPEKLLKIEEIRVQQRGEIMI